MNIDTPSWILQFIKTTPHGGWIHPITTDENHPLIVDGWSCNTCETKLAPGCIGIIQPGPDGWIAHHRYCLMLILGLERTPILRFYAGVDGHNSKHSFEEIIRFKDLDMEHIHDYIQWIFPLPMASKFSRDAPLLTDWDIKRFKEDRNLQVKVLQARDHFFLFLYENEHWRVKSDHNHLRITRMLTFLSLIGMGKEANQTFHQLVSLSEGLVGEVSIGFWKHAISYDDLTS